MKAQFINPFVASAFKVLKQLIGTDMKRGDLSLRKGVAPKYEIAVALGVVGDVRGDVIFSMSTSTALSLASVMAMGMQFDSFDNEIARSAIGELGNMITGNAMTELAAMSVHADISPPTIVSGKGIKVYSTIPSIVVPILTPQGEVELSVALADSEV